MIQTIRRVLTPPLSVLSVLSLFLLSINGANAQDEKTVNDGARLFVVCQSCHTVSPTAKSLFGPSLHGLFGRKAGALPGYHYSAAMKAAGNNGMVWDDQTLDEFLTSPKSVVPGTIMSLEGFADDTDRASLIAYLKLVYSPAGPSVVIMDDPPVPAEVMALPADAEYGEYLASECLSCHQSDGTDDGIPSITGWSSERFVMVMRSYKQKIRKNPVMQTIAGALGDEELVSLAAYFESLK